MENIVDGCAGAESFSYVHVHAQSAVWTVGQSNFHCPTFNIHLTDLSYRDHSPSYTCGSANTSQSRTSCIPNRYSVFQYHILYQYVHSHNMKHCMKINCQLWIKIATLEWMMAPITEIMKQGVSCCGYVKHGLNKFVVVSLIFPKYWTWIPLQKHTM